jgi:integrase
MKEVARPRPDEPIRLVWTRPGPDGEPTKDSEPRYRVTLDAGTHPATKKRRQVTSTHRTLSAARSEVVTVRADKERGVYVAPDRTAWNDYAQQWIDRRSRRVRANTAACYRGMIKHTNEAFGSKPLPKITRADVERMLHQLDDKGRSQRTISLALFVVKAILADALEDGMISRNVAAKIEPFGKSATERRPLTRSDLAKLQTHLNRDRLSAVWMMTLAGLRRSEVLALTWQDIDMVAGTLSITKAVVPDDGGRRSAPTPPKTRRGTRTLPLPPDMLSSLRKLRKAQLAEWGAEQARTGWLAVDEAGRPYRPEEWTQLWAAHCKEADVSSVTLHAARHTSVTTMRDAGVPDHVVAAWHGHDEAVMRRVYSHADQEGMAAAAQALEAAWSGRTSAAL